MAGSAAAAPGLNFTSDKAPDPTITEDTLTVAEHDRGEMDSLTEYYDDNGDVATLPATVNQSQDTPAGVRFDEIDAEQYRLFPRIDGEADNDATWTKTSDWTKTSGASSTMTIADADANGIQKVSADATVATTETATAEFASNVSITSDPNKRVMFAVVDVDTLASGSEVEIRAVDADGDYHSANISAGADANHKTTIANSTGNGYVIQEKLSNLPLDTTAGDGSFDGIQKIQVVAIENNAKVTLTGLDFDKKSTVDLGIASVLAGIVAGSLLVGVRVGGDGRRRSGGGRQP